MHKYSHFKHLKWMWEKILIKNRMWENPYPWVFFFFAKMHVTFLACRYSNMMYVFLPFQSKKEKKRSMCLCLLPTKIKLPKLVVWLPLKKALPPKGHWTSLQSTKRPWTHKNLQFFEWFATPLEKSCTSCVYVVQKYIVVFCSCQSSFATSALLASSSMALYSQENHGVLRDAFRLWDAS